MSSKKDLPPIPQPGNVKLNPVVHRYKQWKLDGPQLREAARLERQRLQLLVVNHQKQIKQLTQIIEDHENNSDQ
jgi:hypothetical protein